MHNRNSIVSAPMLIAIVLSLALHVAALYGKGSHTPPVPTLEQGRTVVHLTLVPSIASQAAAPELPAEPTPEPEPQVEHPAVAGLPALPDPVPEKPTETATVDSPEQVASLQEDKGVISEAALSGAFRPAYPRISHRRGETGTVTLSIQVLSDGSVGNIALLQSSGHRRLDEAALKAARKTTFTPATQLGRRIDSTTELSFTFRLTDD